MKRHRSKAVVARPRGQPARHARAGRVAPDARSTPQSPSPHSRRRGEPLERAILDAAWAELTSAGYAGFRMDAVAARAKTSKTVLYRRWPSRAELVLDALRTHAQTSAEVPDTGTLRGDVMAVLQWLSDRYRDFPEIIRGLMVELPDAGASVAQTSLRLLECVLARAADRGEIATATQNPRLVRMPLDLARYEMFVSRSALSEADIAEIVDAIFLPLLRPMGAASTPARSSPAASGARRAPRDASRAPR